MPINVGKKIRKSKKIFYELQIKNLKLYYDDLIKLANTFSLIGLPTTIFIDKDGDEFADYQVPLTLEIKTLLNGYRIIIRYGICFKLKNYRV